MSLLVLATNTHQCVQSEVCINPICLRGGAQCALTAEIALKTQKNEKKKFLKSTNLLCITFTWPF